ncbi:hypothetical protein TNCV_3865921 [Trichonephila clavipes]|nr:hypothetical protein TNCV_3865921 [Trichonephila clavipes]
MKKDSTNTRRAERKARAGMASNAAELQSYSGRKRTTGPQREQKGRTGYYQGRREKDYFSSALPTGLAPPHLQFHSPLGSQPESIITLPASNQRAVSKLSAMPKNLNITHPDEAR